MGVCCHRKTRVGKRFKFGGGTMASEIPCGTVCGISSTEPHYYRASRDRVELDDAYYWNIVNLVFLYTVSILKLMCT
jgi:hypothetical protein